MFRCKFKLDGFLFTWFKRNLLKPFKFFYRCYYSADNIIDVKLDNFLTFKVTKITHIHTDKNFTSDLVTLLLMAE